jgi:arylsulfatase A-like enzyme
VSQRNAIVVVVDRLSAAYLGPYGNTWIDTPGFNRLASQACLFDHALSDAVDLGRIYGSYWQGIPASQADAAQSATLPRELAVRGVHTQLVTDEPAVAEHPLAQAFDDRLLIGAPRTGTAEEIGHTHLVQLFAAATETLETLTPPYLLWIHARGMEGCWDAPYSLRQAFVEEDDPEPPLSAEPPEWRLSPDYDPDDLWGWLRAYAAQIVVLDHCCAAFLDAFEQSRAANSTLLVWTAPRGFPLGEHLRLGACDNALYGELLHVPWILRDPGGRGAAQRHPGLVQPVDLCPTLLAWWNGPAPLGWRGFDLWPTLEDERDVPRTYAVASNEGEWALGSRNWFARRSREGHIELFVKPDDRLEANDVSTRCPEALAELEQELRERIDLDAAGRP